ncbi:MAG: hypothetical protein JO078_03765 [Candidatus Eremiobacteraeota bacterium]|nr:hypothetical protein [Candidatus Eremiobacteraeota bacterium]MBV9057361.1 hypothetical protein [Candidatus Eremiobacteraeota bacterium]MBV9699225.1 hypothetical protein [Candidatus Eremiobacteraeota bacterium]
MKVSLPTAAIGAALVAVFFFYLGVVQHSTGVAAQIDGNPVGFHMKGNAIIDIAHVKKCAKKACYLTFDVLLSQSTPPVSAVCGKPYCLHFRNPSGQMMMVEVKDESGHVSDYDAYADGLVTTH